MEQKCRNCKFFGLVPAPEPCEGLGGCYYFNFNPMPFCIDSANLATGSDDGKYCPCYEARGVVDIDKS